MTSAELRLSPAIQRLTALWALTESGLGGLLHAVQMPFMGLVLAGIAMTIITLIAYHSDKPAATIGRALVVVLIVKMVVSPHSMPSAYIAVSFQALLGITLYRSLGINAVSILLLTVVGMVETATQRVLSLTLLFGKSLWEALDSMGAWVTQTYSWLLPFQSGKSMIAAYIVIYAVGGALWALFIYKLILRMRSAESTVVYRIVLSTVAADRSTVGSTQKKKSKRPWIWLAIFFLLIIITPYLLDTEMSRGQHALYVLGRTLIALVLWFAIISPFLIRLLRSYLMKRKSELAEEIDQVFSLIPYMKDIVKHAWTEAREVSVLKRIPVFIFKTLMYCLHFEVPVT